MYSIIRLNSSTAQNYKNMTFPCLQPFLGNLSTHTSLIAIGAAFSDQPIGLVLANVREYTHGEYSAEVLSIFVASSQRCRGIGTALLTAMEDELHQRGCRKVLLVYRTGKPTTPILEYLLQKCQWSPPQARLLMCKATLQSIINAPWMHRYSLPAAFSTFLWSELTQDEKMVIQRKQEVEQWYPESLSPFQDEDMIEPLNSLGLRYKGEVVGWMITHRLASDTIRYTSLFVRQDFQKFGRAIPLLAKAIHLQNSSKVTNGIFAVELENKPMYEFVKRRLDTCITSITETRESFKFLQENTSLPVQQSA
jgi:GNAT superfamily N-acetyltransferase